MAAYPTLPTSPGSDPSAIGKIEIDRAEDGTARARSYANDKVKISLEHPWLDATQKATLDAFYTANRLIAFDYLSPSDNISRSMLFAQPPRYSRKQGEFWVAKVEIEEV